mgnify:CR=1 FL=1
MYNPVHWFEIPTLDLERAKGFYQEVLQLEFQYLEMPDSKMLMFGDPEGIGSGGCLFQQDGSNPTTDGTVVYFSSEDLSVPLSRVEDAGGQVLIPKTDIGEFGFFAHIIDSEGNKIGLHSRA